MYVCNDVNYNVRVIVALVGVAQSSYAISGHSIGHKIRLALIFNQHMGERLTVYRIRINRARKKAHLARPSQARSDSAWPFV